MSHESVPPSGLAQLTWPLGTREFLERVWEQSLHVHHGGPSRVHEIAPALCDLPLSALVKMADGEILAMFRTPSGAGRTAKVSAEDAPGLYEAGMTLYFHLSPREPFARAWLDTLATELGHLPDALRIGVFASPRGALTEWHFDTNNNFVMQLRGAKRWRLAANDFIARPTERFTTSERVPEVLRLATSEPPPERFTRDARDLELRPGSLLYVPRGMWHCVEALEDSLHVNFSIAPVPWSSIVLPALQRLLLTNEAFRENALGAFGSEAQRRAARERLDLVLRELPQLLTGFRASDVIGRAPGAAPEIDEGTPLRRHRVATLGLESRADAGDGAAYAATIVIPGSPPVRLALTSRLTEACRWIRAREATFTLSELARATGGAPPGLLALAQRLVQIGFLHAEAATE